MPRFKPISWRELVKHLKRFGFEGPYQSGKHPYFERSKKQGSAEQGEAGSYMIKGNLTLTIPNPHSKDISADLLLRILKQAEIDKKDWIAKE